MSTLDASPTDDDDDTVATCDAARGLPRHRARALADRLYFLGFLALPWLWVLNAWTFAPHVDPRSATSVDAHVANRARASRALAAGASVVILTWALTFYLGGASLFGDGAFERLAVTTARW